ncbi:hypothetical protein LOTGIDRAFT_169162 [Lottia gigantea]|uniref:Uncharacterized protein n=1 Tax=Lottia gigantea TaxID=225164 RepID=V3ZHK1_LOTGI|nr:hypothetical protein LOTGIDRAFT_169162 [Lottia gigantea]ESO83682.1 hypothetical protein LOTGIDRAFT_169162 [Lottia gigantea]
MAANFCTDDNFNVEYDGVVYVMNPEQVTRLTNDPKSIDDINAEKNSLRDTGSDKEMVACSKSLTSCSTANSNSSSIGSSTCYFLLYIYVKSVNKSQTKGEIIKNHNPLKYYRKTRTGTEGEDSEFIDQLISFTTYDATDVPSLDHFDVIQRNSACIFAKTANIWGSPEWNDKLSLEENTFRLLPTFLMFSVKCSSLNIDGFVIQLPADISSNLEVFSTSVRKVLKVISDQDPGGGHSMTKSYIDKPGWVFEFNKITMFITTFAPFYPESNSRFSFASPYGFILFQPELSFAKHNLPPDTVITNWDTPKTVRDRIRITFKDKGQEYTIPATVNYPMVNDIVKPLKEGNPVIKWWKNKEE